MLQDETICLRPLSRADLPLFETWANDLQFDSEYNSFGLSRPDRLAAGFDSWEGYLSTYSGMLVITLLDDTVIGNVSYHPQRYGPNEASTAYNIGISIHADYRYHGYGTQAQMLLTEYLFATYPVQRVEASTDITNRAEQRSLEKAGFTRDGILRQAQWRNGGWHDLVVYSKLRGEA
jgi:RimJ/RimL family protein N-acetyltransferase